MISVDRGVATNVTPVTISTNRDRYSQARRDEVEDRAIKHS